MSTRMIRANAHCFFSSAILLLRLPCAAEEKKAANLKTEHRALVEADHDYVVKCCARTRCASNRARERESSEVRAVGATPRV